jgi:hypothetical protein
LKSVPSLFMQGLSCVQVRKEKAPPDRFRN